MVSDREPADEFPRKSALPRSDGSSLNYFRPVGRGMINPQPEEETAMADDLNNLDVKVLLESLPDLDQERLIRQISYFSSNEAKQRDELAQGYLGMEGIDAIATAVADQISPRLPTATPTILDVGAGIGTFTELILTRLRSQRSGVTIFALDVTPSMLKVACERDSKIIPVLGLAENISGSVRRAQQSFAVPSAFDAVISTLAFHHFPNIAGVLSGIRDALVVDGTAVVVDLCQHSFAEFREEMGDYHLGFRTEDFAATASEFFSDVKVSKLSGPSIVCSSSGRSAELFIAVMRS
jgi:SAM-dependent methyltransferase